MADKGLYINPNTPKPKGMVKPGNIDLTKLPVIDNHDGSYSTVYGTSFTDDNEGSPTFRKDVLVRGILNGVKTDDVDALRKQYYKTGQHLGVFEPGTPQQYKTGNDPASQYAQQLHNDWSTGAIPGVAMHNQPVTPTIPPAPQVNMQPESMVTTILRALGNR